MRHTYVAALLCGLAFSQASRAANFTTSVAQASGQNWNAAIWDPGAVSPTAGNTYETIENGTAFGNNLPNTRIRNPATAGLQTFPGDVLTVNANTEIRAKQAGAILNFPGVGGNPGLILKGGVLNAGDDTVFTITGKVQVASTSYIVPADNGGGGVKILRGFNIAAQLSGSGKIVIYQAGTNVAQEFSGSGNTFSGGFLVKAGLLKGSTPDSLGTGDITIDPLADVGADPSVSLLEGPALLDVMYNIASPGRLTLVNGGMMILHQTVTFGAVNIEGTNLSKGPHSYAELAAAFPNNFAPGGSGGITVGVAAPRFTTKVTQASGQNWVGNIWDPGATAPVAGAVYEVLSNGTPFGNNLGNARLRNPATAGLQTFPGDSLTLNTNTEIRAKQAGAVLNFPGVGGLPGLILNGGVLNAGDDAVFTVTGRVQVASTSFIVPADNGGGAIKPLRGFNIAAQLSGSAPLVIYQAGTNVAQEISGVSNSYAGEFVVKAGYLKASGNGSLGSASVTIDPKIAVGADASVTLAEGPALFEANYDASSPGRLTVANGGQVLLHQKLTFDRATINGVPLDKGTHSYAELAAAFPENFPAGGSGSITAVSGPGHFTTTVTQAGGTAWTAPIWEPGPVAPSAGNTYELIENGTTFGNNQSNTRLRNPAAAGIQTFPGDSLTINTNTEIRAKQAGAILNFPGVGGNPGLILNGGVLNAGDDTLFELRGRIKVAGDSFIVPGDNGGGGVREPRGFNISGQVSGNGKIIIYQAGMTVAQEFSGNQNTFTGGFIVKAGWLKGSGLNSLGTGNIVIDPLIDLGLDPSIAPAEGPAQFEVSYDINSPGSVTLANGGMMILHQDCTFRNVTIEGTALTKGKHSYAELAAAFPATFAPDGSGSITIADPAAPAIPTNLSVVNGNAQVTVSWSPSVSATGYVISRGTTSGGPYTPLGSAAGTNFVSTGLVNGTTYYYVVAATNAVGTSANSAQVVARPNAAVTGLTAVGGAGSVTLNWTAYPNATGYTIRRGGTSGGPYTNIASGITAASYTDTTVQNGTQYYYVVIASLGGGNESGISSEVTATTFPSVPTLTVDRYTTTGQLLRIGSPDPVRSTFILETSTNGTTFTPLVTLTNGTYLVTGLKPGVTYYYRVQGQNTGGKSAVSGATSAATPTFAVNVNFANAINGTPANNPAPTPTGYVQDVGEVFGDRGNGLSYGWDRDVTTDGRYRQNVNSPDLRYDTFEHFQKASPSAIWEVQIPNGQYDVHIVSGDPTATDSVFEHDIEGVITATYTPVSGAWWGEWTTNVTVADGRLTVTTGPDGQNNKINFIDIYPVVKEAGRFTSTTRSGNNVTINWTGSGRLQEAASVTGPWTDVAGNPQSTYSVSAAAPRKFYRLSSP